ncbi:uncharacterized protein HHUB_4065 (plasmid) [Halobacterium hubeiense]|uniref:Uncharacterized protein n=1 Tax=Halobacterium hubeiense TaxID=1407499 RepID=A0A0U5H462_9EURY|nr:hypothetical protein [Halobacterium hubeiense]CQH63396.1 uncharacterized protein HHUB_4065 [Halobacterium hubeiense]
MPESPPPRTDRIDRTRRRVLAGGGTVATAALAGCSGLFETGPRTLETVVHEDSAAELSWDFPAQSEAESVGYVEISTNGQSYSDGSVPSAGFTVEVGIDPSSGYELAEFTVRLATPNAYFDRRGQVTYLVSPPARSDDTSAYYRRLRSGSIHRQLVVELAEVGVDGNVEFPVVVREAQSLPSALQCSFSLRAVESGTFGETVTASASGTFEFAADGS